MARADEESDEEFGAWSYEMTSRATKMGEERLRNPSLHRSSA